MDVASAVRGRLAYAFDSSWTTTRGFIEVLSDGESKSFNGWPLRAGIDCAFANNICACAEYRVKSSVGVY